MPKVITNKPANIDASEIKWVTARLKSLNEELGALETKDTAKALILRAKYNCLSLYAQLMLLSA